MFDAVTYGAAVGAAKRYTDEHSGSDDAVKYTEQSLTSEQQAQARTNIGAGTSNFSGSYSDLTDAPPLVKGNGSGGNTVGGTGVNTNTTRYANSVAYGNITEAAANYALAFGEYAFAGNYNRSTGKHAVSIGNNVRAEKDYEFAYGKFNQSNADTAFSIGDGTSDSDRHNLLELKTDGRMFLNGNAVKTEGGDDDNKLRLGQITANAKYGIGNILSSAPSSVTFLTIDTPRDLSGTGTIGYRFGDFYLYSSSGAKIAPIAGYTEIISKTGQWIHAENCYCMFYNCDSSAMTSLDVSMLDTSEVKNMAYMFYNCMALTSLDLSSFDTSKVQNMSSMFAYCAALKTLDISSFDMSNVIFYDKMFGEANYWAGITTLKTPKINPHNNISLPRTLYSQDGTAYKKLPVTTGTSIELRQSWA